MWIRNSPNGCCNAGRIQHPKKPILLVYKHDDTKNIYVSGIPFPSLPFPMVLRAVSLIEHFSGVLLQQEQHVRGCRCFCKQVFEFFSDLLVEICFEVWGIFACVYCFWPYYFRHFLWAVLTCSGPKQFSDMLRSYRCCKVQGLFEQFLDMLRGGYF